MRKAGRYAVEAEGKSIVKRVEGRMGGSKETIALLVVDLASRCLVRYHILLCESYPTKSLRCVKDWLQSEKGCRSLHKGACRRFPTGDAPKDRQNELVIASKS